MQLNLHSILLGLFLNNSKAGAYYYYWLLKTCSINSSNSECPTFGGGKYGNQWPGYFNKGRFRDPSTLYWVDTNGEWCNGISSPACYWKTSSPIMFLFRKKVEELLQFLGGYIQIP